MANNDTPKKKPTGNKVGVKDGKLKTTYDKGTPLHSIFNVPASAKGNFKLSSMDATRDALNRHRWANLHGRMVDYPEGQAPSFQYSPEMMEHLKQRGLTREYIESYQPGNYENNITPEQIPELGFGGGILASMGKGAATGALSGSAVPGLGTLAGGIIGGIGGLFGGLLGRRKEKRQEEMLAQQQAQQQSMLSQQQVVPEDPMVNPEGMVSVDNQYAPTFPGGGQVQTQLAELEAGEPFRTPDGSIAVVKEEDRLSHANGGATMPLEVGTQVLGKSKDPDTKKTYKEMGKKLALQKKKYDKILDGTSGTYSQNAAKAMNAKIDKQFTTLFEKQEAGKPQPQGQTGGIQQAGIGAVIGGLGAMNVANKVGQGGGFLSKIGGFLGKNNISGPNGLLNTMGQLAPVGYNLAQGMQPAQHLNPQDFYNPQQGQAIQGGQRAMDLLGGRRANVDPMLEANRNAQAIGEYNAINQGGLSSGAIASNRLAGMAQRMRGDQSARAWEQNQNNQYRGQQAQGELQFSNMRAGLGAQQAATNYNVAQDNLGADAARRNMLGAGFSGISDYAQRQQLMAGQGERDQQRLGILEDMYPMMGNWFPGMYGGGAQQGAPQGTQQGAQPGGPGGSVSEQYQKSIDAILKKYSAN